jgi:hypothetical protein
MYKKKAYFFRPFLGGLSSVSKYFFAGKVKVILVEKECTL